MKIVISQNSPLGEAKSLLKKYPNAIIFAQEAYEKIGGPESARIDGRLKGDYRHRSQNGRLFGFKTRDSLLGTEPNIVVLDFWSLTHEIIVAASIQLGRRHGICRLVLCVKPWPQSAFK